MNLRGRHRTAAILAALGIILAGCGDSDDGQETADEERSHPTSHHGDAQEGTGPTSSADPPGMIPQEDTVCARIDPTKAGLEPATDID